MSFNYSLLCFCFDFSDILIKFSCLACTYLPNYVFIAFTYNTWLLYCNEINDYIFLKFFHILKTVENQLFFIINILILQLLINAAQMLRYMYIKNLKMCLQGVS